MSSSCCCSGMLLCIGMYFTVYITKPLHGHLRNRHAKEHVSAPGAPRRTASGTSGLCTPSPPSFIFGPINTCATSAGMGTMSKAHRHDSVSAVAHVAKHCGHGPTLNNMTSFVHYNIFCISHLHMHMDRRAFVLGTYFAHFFLYSTTLLYCRTG